MGCKLYMNSITTLIAFYIVNVLKFAESMDAIDSNMPIQISLIPLILYITSTLVSISLDKVYAKLGRKLTFYAGTVLSVLAAVGFLFLTENSRDGIYAIVFLCGVSQTATMNTAINLTSEVIGEHGA